MPIVSAHPYCARLRAQIHMPRHAQSRSQNPRAFWSAPRVDTELWNNQFPETKVLGLPASQRTRGLVYMASRDKVDVDTFHEGIQYALERLRKSKFGLESTTVSNFKSKSHEGSGNELVDYSRAPCLGADQKARGLWERDCVMHRACAPSTKMNNNRADGHCYSFVWI